MGSGYDKIEIIDADGYDVSAPWSDRELELYGLRSAADGGLLFCGVTEQRFAIDGVRYQWPKGSKLAWCLGFDRLHKLSDMDLKGAVLEMTKEISHYCNIDFEYTPKPSQANILVNLAHLDGPSGVLADMGIPMRNAHPDRTQLKGRVDSSEIEWVISENPGPKQLDWFRTQFHELLHALGLGHQPTNARVPALIAPTYSTRIRYLQAPDIEELVIRYGARETTPYHSKPKPPAAGGDIAKVSVTVEINGKRVTLSGEKEMQVVAAIRAAGLH
jgi:hypothetical protein